MADHITIDLERLRDTATALGAIAGALRDTAGTSPADPVVLGHPALTAVMRDFTGSWRVHREQLVSSVEAHQKMVRAAADQHHGLDAAFADALTPAGSPPPDVTPPAGASSPTTAGGPR